MISCGSTLLRADHLATAPVVGRYYLVPAILWPIRGNMNSDRWVADTEAETLALWQAHPAAQWWPVWGRKHCDHEFFNFPNLHYHIDPRFLTVRQWRRFGYWRDPLAEVQGSPVNGTPIPSGPPPPTLRRMRCSRPYVQWQHANTRASIAMNNAFAGRQCAHSERGWICPHQHFSVGATPAIDGIVTCPLHGMRIHAETGLCAGPAAA